MDIARQNFLAGSGFAGDEDRGFGRRDLISHGDDPGAGFVLENELMRLVGDGGQDGRDQCGIGGQRHIFLGAGANGVHRTARIGSDAAGNDGSADALGGQRTHQHADIQRHVRHHQIGAAARAQLGQGLVDAGGVGNLGAIVQRDSRGGADLSAEAAYDQ